MKTETILSIYTLLNTAKLTNLEDADKIKVIKFMRKIKPVYTQFEDAKTDALEKAKGEDHNKYAEILRQWQKEGNETTLSEEDRINANKYFADYEKLVLEALKDLSEKEVDIEFDKLSEDGFIKLVSSNDWNVQQSMLIEDVLA